MFERINCTTEEIRVLKQIELVEDTELFVLLNCGGRFFLQFCKPICIRLLWVFKGKNW